jgi:hypothetical protein
MPPRTRRPRALTRERDAFADIPDSIDGENDIAALPADTLRSTLIAYGYHPLVVRALSDFAAQKCTRELIERLPDSRRVGYFLGMGSRPLFGPPANAPPPAEVAFSSSPWSAFPRTAAAFPRGSWQAQPLQSDAALDLNTKLLNCGVVQTEVDALPPEKIAEVVEAFERGSTRRRSSRPWGCTWGMACT